MTTRSRIVRFIASIAAAALAVLGVGLTPAHAEGETLGNADLQAAVNNTVTAMKTTGIVFAAPGTGEETKYRYVMKANSKLVPANLAASAVTNGVTATYLYEIAPDNALLGGSWGVFIRPETVIGYEGKALVFPDESGFKLGVPNNRAVTLDSYEVTQPTSESFLVHQQTTDASQAGGDILPMVTVTDALFTVAKGRIAKMLITKTIDGVPDNNTRATYYNYSAKHIDGEFSKAVAQWKKSFNVKYQSLVTKLTAAFNVSKQAALKSGVTINDSIATPNGYPQKGTYDPATKKSVTYGLNMARKIWTLGFGDATNVYGLTFTNLVGAVLTPGIKITYAAKTRTYTVVSQEQSTSKIKLDAKGRIVSASIEGVFGAESKTFTYAPTKSLLKKWAGLTPKAIKLARWLAQYHASGQIGGFFTQTGSTITLDPGPNGTPLNFDVAGLKAGVIARVFDLLGRELVQG